MNESPLFLVADSRESGRRSMSHGPQRAAEPPTYAPVTPAHRRFPDGRYDELTEITRFLNEVLESSTAYSIITKDLQRNILSWNEGARRHYGYSAEEMVGKRNGALLQTPENITSGHVQALFDEALAAGNAAGVFEQRRKSGERFTSSVSVTLRCDASGAPTGYMLISRDITEQTRREEQYKRLREANRIKSEFLANMSHELRTPLNAIIGFSELLFDGLAGPLGPTQREFVGDILSSSRHLLQLINDVLDLAKVEAGKLDFAPQPVKLDKLVGEVCDVMRALMAKRRVKVVTDIAPEVGDIVADPGKLKQVLYNYLSNALKFCYENSEVRVGARPVDADHFRLEVEDHGIGIRPQDLSRLFVEFQQVDTGGKCQGTGLGLALTKRIVEAQGGRVGVNSQYGQGCVFYAILPRKLAAFTAPAPL